MSPPSPPSASTGAEVPGRAGWEWTYTVDVTNFGKVLRTQYDAFSNRRAFAYRFFKDGRSRPCQVCQRPTYSEWPVKGSWAPICSAQCCEVANARA